MNAAPVLPVAVGMVALSVLTWTLCARTAFSGLDNHTVLLVVIAS